MIDIDIPCLLPHSNSNYGSWLPELFARNAIFRYFVCTKLMCIESNCTCNLTYHITQNRKQVLFYSHKLRVSEEIVIITPAPLKAQQYYLICYPVSHQTIWLIYLLYHEPEKKPDKNRLSQNNL
jgi:hypothetical protein